LILLFVGLIFLTNTFCARKNNSICYKIDSLGRYPCGNYDSKIEFVNFEFAKFKFQCKTKHIYSNNEPDFFEIRNQDSLAFKIYDYYFNMNSSYNTDIPKYGSIIGINIFISNYPKIENVINLHEIIAISIIYNDSEKRIHHRLFYFNSTVKSLVEVKKMNCFSTGLSTFIALIGKKVIFKRQNNFSIISLILENHLIPYKNINKHDNSFETLLEFLKIEY
jgi:hypothetical protein